MRGLWTVAVLVLLLAAGAVSATAKVTPRPIGTQAHAIGEVFRDCPECPEMVAIPGGRFAMGSPSGERGRYDAEGPQHAVSVPAIAVGRYDVTVQEFATFVKATGYDGGACDWPSGTSWRSSGFIPADPVVCVSWHDANAYIDWLNARVHGLPSGSTGLKGPYRLPTEAEWEYAARAGTRTSRWWGDGIGTGNANCNGCGSRWDDKQLSPVGSFPPNPFGLYDMLGNVWQWTEDCWNENYEGAPADGRAWTSGDCGKRVLRGGSWSNLPTFLRSAARNRDSADNRSFDFASYAGFRVVRELP
ncbi:formylglycine-generating enzyme family protein [Telmatospirillum sp.]|uniref:formylglycine-generating enzyme family protein n=1 Tax=Telmatospirillum sp. TaxID=2079197 RepID=UPI00284D627E|nr:formylglycine-generating enzyme family protein [Telmatospirillum sp.]MDR3437902.1 formylglycine-generating enzyme family protein [Telmatospirillum sp.]